MMIREGLLTEPILVLPDMVKKESDLPLPAPTPKAQVKRDLQQQGPSVDASLTSKWELNPEELVKQEQIGAVRTRKARTCSRLTDAILCRANSAS